MKPITQLRNGSINAILSEQEKLKQLELTKSDKVNFNLLILDYVRKFKKPSRFFNSQAVMVNAIDIEVYINSKHLDLIDDSIKIPNSFIFISDHFDDVLAVIIDKDIMVDEFIHMEFMKNLNLIHTFTKFTFSPFRNCLILKEGNNE